MVRSFLFHSAFTEGHSYSEIVLLHSAFTEGHSYSEIVFTAQCIHRGLRVGCQPREQLLPIRTSQLIFRAKRPKNGRHGPLPRNIYETRLPGQVRQKVRLRNVGYRADEKKTSFFLLFFFFAHPSLTFDLVTRRDLTRVRIEQSMLASQAKAEQQSERLVDFDQNQQNRLCLTFTADDRSQL